jgi:hypothetical protein
MREFEQRNSSKLTTFPRVIRPRSLEATKTCEASIITLDSYRLSNKRKRVMDEFAEDLTMLTRIIGC